MTVNTSNAHLYILIIYNHIVLVIIAFVIQCPLLRSDLDSHWEAATVASQLENSSGHYPQIQAKKDYVSH